MQLGEDVQQRRIHEMTDLSEPIKYANWAQQGSGAPNISVEPVVAGLKSVFSALYAVERPARATLSEWVQVATAVAHLQALAAETAEYEMLQGLFGDVFDAMAGAARGWNDFGIRPDAQAWYLKLLPQLMQTYVALYKRAPLGTVAETRQRAGKSLCDHLFR